MNSGTMNSSYAYPPRRRFPWALIACVSTLVCFVVTMKMGAYVERPAPVAVPIVGAVRVFACEGKVTLQKFPDGRVGLVGCREVKSCRGGQLQCAKEAR